MNRSKTAIRRSLPRILAGIAGFLLLCVPASPQTLAWLDAPEIQQGAPPNQNQPQSQAPAPGQPPAQTPAQTGTGAAQPKRKLTPEEQEQAEKELQQEEKQRILRVMPDFNMTNNQQALPLSSRQKFQLMFKSSTDPFIFVTAALVAGLDQAQDAFPGYGQGMVGYAKRFGASYADTADGNLWGSAILPSLLHEDPRYFRRGAGSFLRRALYSASAAVWCRRDNRRWGPNYSNVGGNLIAGGISNLYYPASDRGFSLTIDRAMVVTAEGMISTEIIEFWPDIEARFLHRHSKSAKVPATNP